VESLFYRLNHQLPAFLLHYLQEKGLPKEFVTELLRKSCDPTLVGAAFNCTWDEKDHVVTRPDEEELKKQREEDEKANSWYKDMINMHLVTSQRSPKKAHIAPEARYDLDAERSVKTINVHKKKTKKNTIGTKAATYAKSTGDSDSSGKDDSDQDSASDNARKPYSTVGFEKKTEEAIEIESSSSSEEESSTDGDGDSQNSVEEGGGG